MVKIVTWLNNPYDCDLVDLMTFAKLASGRHMRIIDELDPRLVPNAGIVVWEGDESASDQVLRDALANDLGRFIRGGGPPQMGAGSHHGEDTGAGALGNDSPRVCDECYVLDRGRAVCASRPRDGRGVVMTAAERIRQFADSIGAQEQDVYEAYESYLAPRDVAALRNLMVDTTLSDWYDEEE